MTTTSLETIYRSGFDAARDVVRIKPNMVLVRGIKAPDTLAGIKLPFQSSIAGAQALMFRVEGVGELRQASWGPSETALEGVAIGDLVVPRHANLDPVSTDDHPLFVLDVRDVLFVVRPECASTEATP